MRSLAASLTFVAACLPFTADAASDKLRLGIFGSGKGTGPLLTRVELRECLALKERVGTGSEAAAREREQIEKEKAELMRQGEELKAEFEKIDRDSVEALEQHRDRALARDKAIDAFEVRATEFNDRLAALNAERSTFMKRCDNRRFDQVDEEAIRKGK
ncbi:hypothetical protein [Variovorax sp. YR752]|uniref:hypothetical protein n=1 Tax=Variovorax sp. YR752 TaxID=1884383 RepID=UPI0031384368